MSRPSLLEEIPISDVQGAPGPGGIPGIFAAPFSLGERFVSMEGLSKDQGRDLPREIGMSGSLQPGAAPPPSLSCLDS